MTENTEIKTARKKGKERLETTSMPESVRTPGRTWTRYEDCPKEIEPDFTSNISSEGEVEVSENPDNIPKMLMDQVKVEEDYYTALHAAELQHVIHVKAEGQGKVEISYEGEDVNTHLILEAQKGADVTVEKHYTNKGNTLSIDELYLEPNSTVRYAACENSKGELSYARRRAVLKRDSTIEWLNGQLGSSLNKTDIDTVLKGDNTEVHNLGVWYPTKTQHVDISIRAEHLGQNTKCTMDSKAAVDDQSRSAYKGVQRVGNKADDTKSFQDEDVISLSEEAEVDASPKLMIEDPDVEASHAASAGSLPEEELHYLRSRGLTRKQSKKLVLEGFFEPVIEESKAENVKNSIRRIIDQKIRGTHKNQINQK
jgi:Fe-S cluster assembly protein SufD